MANPEHLAILGEGVKKMERVVDKSIGGSGRFS